MIIFAETPRLSLRSLESDDLPRVVELIGDWDVAKWLAHVPYPYTLKDAEEFHARIADGGRHSELGGVVMTLRTDNRLMGIVGLHPSREDPKTDEIELGYWLGKPYWGQGFMTEAAQAMVAHALRQSGINAIISTTDPANQASQNVLRKTGFSYLGIHARTDTGLRGGAEVTRWRMDKPRPASAQITGT